MTAINELDLQILLHHLDQLRPEVIHNVPLAELEWILADFVLSLGQRLPLDSADWPTEPERANLQRFGATIFPFSTASDFPAVSPDQVRTLAVALASLNLYVIVLDPIVDEPSTPAAAKLVLQPLLLHFYRWASLLFPSGSPFWSQVEQNMDLMSQTMLAECYRLHGPPRPFSLDEFQKIALGKMAFTRINSMALALLNSTPQLIAALNRCWDAISLSSIVNDDALDWRTDYSNANYTYLVSQVLFSPPFRDQVEAGQLPKIAEIGAALFYADQIESFFMLASEELGKAAQQAAAINCPALANLLRYFQTQFYARAAKFVNNKVKALIAMAINDPVPQSGGNNHAKRGICDSIAR